jgi:hypothetical protein
MLILTSYDGQAGAAAITLNSSTPEKEAAFAADLYIQLRQRGLTGYQVPRLVRFVEA